MESNIIACHRCSSTGDALTEMRVIGGPVLGPCMDMGMAARWFCDTCFEDVRKDPVERARINQWLDSAEIWAKACVSSVTDEKLQEMSNLPEGLRVTPEDKQRLRSLRDKLDDINQLQDREDLAVLHKVCRNINHNPYWHSPRGTIRPYEDLVQDLRKLEDLTPEQRRSFNADVK